MLWTLHTRPQVNRMDQLSFMLLCLVGEVDRFSNFEEGP